MKYRRSDETAWWCRGHRRAPKSTPVEIAADLRGSAEVRHHQVDDRNCLQGLQRRRHDTVLCEPATVRSVGAPPPATGAHDRHERDERVEAQVLRQSAGPALTRRIAT